MGPLHHENNLIRALFIIEVALILGALLHKIDIVGGVPAV